MVALALAPPPKSDPPESMIRPAHPAQVAEESLDVNSTEIILAAIKELDTKLDGALRQQAADAEWRKNVDATSAKHEKRLEDLEKADRARELSIVRIMAWAGGAGAVSGFVGSAVVAVIVAVLVKMLAPH